MCYRRTEFLSACKNVHLKISEHTIITKVSCNSVSTQDYKAHSNSTQLNIQTYSLICMLLDTCSMNTLSLTKAMIIKPFESIL